MTDTGRTVFGTTDLSPEARAFLDAEHVRVLADNIANPPPPKDDDWAFCWREGLMDEGAGTYLSVWIEYKAEKFWEKHFTTPCVLDEGQRRQMVESFRESYMAQFVAVSQKLIDGLDKSGGEA